MTDHSELPDLCLTGAVVADVVNGKWLADTDVIVNAGKIASLVPVGSVKTRETVNLTDKYLLPAFIDSHMHIESSELTPEHLAGLLAIQGTGTIIADPHEIANVLGTKGIDYMIAAARRSLIDVRIMLPSCVPATPFEHAGATLSAKDLEPYFGKDSVLGLAEVMNIPGVLNDDPEMLAKLKLALDRGCPIDGHAPLLSGEGLKIYAAHGISSDHECSTLKEVQERIACGISVSLRQGSAAKNLDTLIDAVTPETAPHCMFCCDDINAAEVFHDGHMQRHLRLAVSRGVNAMTAVQLATINSARHYGLKESGSIDAGKRADFTVVDDLRNFNVLQTWICGRKVAENGKLVVAVNAAEPPAEVLSSVHIQPVKKKDFEIHLPSGKARVIEVVARDLLTHAKIETLKTVNKLFNAKLNPGFAQVAVIERHNATGNIGLGIVSGYLKPGALMNGAVATTIAHDSHNIVVIGDGPENMLTAVNALKDMGGGMVLVKNGQVAAALKLEVAGLMSKEPADVFIPQQVEFHRKAHELFDIVEGVDPVMTLSFLALPVIPELRITDMGLFDFAKFAHVDVAVE